MIRADMRCAYRDLEARLRPFVARRVSDPASVDDVVQDGLPADATQLVRPA
jgi:RNA polymerase sigma-70 factor (ECF subfamily)